MITTHGRTSAHKVITPAPASYRLRASVVIIAVAVLLTIAVVNVLGIY